MKLATSEHTKHNWIVQSLLADFKIEDVWRLPVVLEKHHRLEDLEREFSNALKSIEKKGVAGMLFQFRMFLGNVFHWDEKREQTHLIPGSIRERYASQEDLTYADLPSPGDGEFVPVYKLEEEVLLEIENATVHAAVHFSKVVVASKEFAVNMAIYVKAKGFFGRFYMLLIKPFRLAIIYPTLLKTIKKQWNQYLTES